MPKLPGLGETVDLGMVLHDLGARGIGRLGVEGGTIHTQFLTRALADEIQLTIAPSFAGDAAAPQFVGSASSLAI